MTFQETLDDIRAKIDQFGEALDNEEMTKDVLIRPMIHALGYDTSDPTEVRAEYRVKLAKGGRGRADYVLMRDGRPAVVVECKAWGTELDQKIQQQMIRYGRALGSIAGLVTDGDRYLCYANTDDEEKIDNWSFHELDISAPADRDQEALALFSKKQFSSQELRANAKTFATALEQRERLGEFLSDPTLVEEVVRLSAIKDPAQREAELSATLETMEEIVRDVVARFARGEIDEPSTVTTHEELDAFWLCKGMLHGVIDPDRVGYRDRKTYFSVLIDDNNRKPICRFHFDGRVKQVGTFDADRQETRHAIEEIDDLLKHARTLRSTARQYAES